MEHGVSTTNQILASGGKDILLMPIEELMTTPSKYGLKIQGLGQKSARKIPATYVGELLFVTEDEIQGAQGVGVTSAFRIRALCDAIGLDIGSRATPAYTELMDGPPRFLLPINEEKRRQVRDFLAKQLSIGAFEQAAPAPTFEKPAEREIKYDSNNRTLRLSYNLSADLKRGVKNGNLSEGETASLTGEVIEDALLKEFLLTFRLPTDESSDLKGLTEDTRWQVSYSEGKVRAVIQLGGVFKDLVEVGKFNQQRFAHSVARQSEDRSLRRLSDNMAARL
jgi:hypothetical protein